MEVRLYFQMLKRGWWIIALTTLTALTAALGVSYLSTPQYESVARFIVAPATDLADRYQVLNSMSALENQVISSTYAEVMNSGRIYSDALAFLQLQYEDLEDYNYEAVVVPNTSVLELSVTGPDPQLTAKLANAVGYQTINFIRQLNQVYSFDFLDVAVPANKPFSPNLLLNINLALILGIIVGAVLAIMNEQLRVPLEALRQRLYFDPITGVYTGDYFSRVLDDELGRHPDTVLTIGVMELSGLRDLVETLPIVSLQGILQKVTIILRNELRGNDVIGRWHENGFIIMLPSTTGGAAKGIFDRIYQALMRPFELEQLGVVIDLDIHIGGAEYSNKISTQELLAKANTALEQSRRSSDDPVYVWEFKNPFWSQPILDDGKTLDLDSHHG